MVGERGGEGQGRGTADVGFLEGKSRCQRKDGLRLRFLQSLI